MKEMAIIEEDGMVSGIISCEDDREETDNLKSFNSTNYAYEGGDFFEGYFYPKKFNKNWKRDGKGGWIVDEKDRDVKEYYSVEEIWCKSKGCIIGKIIRTKDLKMKRYDNNNKNIENYEVVRLEDIKNINVRLKYNKEDFIQTCGVSKNEAGEITDFYFGIKTKTDIRISDSIIEKYNLNKKLASVVRIVGLRYNVEGNLLGYYYEGGYMSLVKAYLEDNQELKDKILSHYKSLDIKPHRCVVKDFGDGAIYVVYNEHVL